jgi:hypothetical protein
MPLDKRYQIPGFGAIVEDAEGFLHAHLSGADPQFRREHLVEAIRQLSIAPGDPTIVSILRRILGLDKPPEPAAAPKATPTPGSIVVTVTPPIPESETPPPTA